MGGLSLLNFRSHPAASAPTATAAGQLYYNTGSNTLYYSVGTGTGNWTAVGTSSGGVTTLNGLSGALTIAGTTNQIAVSAASTTVTLSLPTNVTLPGKTTLTASTTGASALNIPTGSDPTSPVSGDFWNNTGVFKFYNGSATKSLAFLDSTLTGLWNGTVIGPAYGGTGVANNAANTLTFTGNFSLGLTLSANTSVTLPTSGTLLTTTGSGSSLTFGTGSLSLAGNLTTSGAFTTTLTATGNTSVTLPTSGTLVNTAVTTLSSLSSIGTIATGVWNGTAITTAYGGTGLTTYTAGDLLYYSTGTTLSKLGIGTTNYVLTSSGSAPQYVAQSTLSVGSATTATNATNTAITDDTSTATAQYLTWVGATSGNNAQKVTSTRLTFVPSTGTLAATIFSGSGASLTSIPNSATTAVSTNTASAIVARDSSGNFAAGTITAALTGNASTATTLATPRAINGVNFDGSAAITVTAAAGTLTGSTLNSGVTASSLTSVGTLSGLTATGTVNLGGATTVTVPTPVNNTDAANKAYVDNVASGVNAHDAVQFATTTTIAGTYAAGTTGADGGTGVGATITYSATGTTSIDGGANLALNDRVLVKNGVTADAGTTSKANGIYYVTTAGATGVATILTRALDSDNSIAGDITAGDLVYILGGGQGGTQWIQTATGTATTPNKGIKIGTDSITFTQFSGASSTTAGAGLVANGNAFDVGTASTTRIVVNADNIDLATVTRTDTTSQVSGTFVQSLTTDSYGRVTASTTGTHTLAAADGTTKGIAAFNATRFTATSGVIDIATGGIGNTQLANSTISGISLGSNLATLTFGTGLSGTSYNGSTGVTIGYASGTTSQSATGVSGGTYSYATQKQSATITGDNTTSSFTVNHNLASRDVQVQVYQTSASPDTQYSEVEVDIVRATTGTITVAFATAPATGITYNVVIIG